MTASEADLLAHAVDRIPERAAHPKFVRILRSMPITPVGKIFKPALSMLEIEDVVRQEEAASGIRLVSLTVVQDPPHGLLAIIATECDPAPTAKYSVTMPSRCSSSEITRRKDVLIAINLAAYEIGMYIILATTHSYDQSNEQNLTIHYLP
ncbi:hypothetical protein [Rhizobium grahamii]|uniref:hypothetical protein n=1 Tax=Rhizobium grahamii TaxID=1120045 RepID=UPI001FD4021D|nr:hypothetical protein [Rhizobium grahamii]